MQPRPFRTVMLNTTVVIAALSLAGVGAEGVLRLAGHRPASDRYRTVVGDSIHVRDSVLGWRANPGASFVVESPEYRNRVRLDAFGARGRGEWADSSCRVLVLGDSFVAAYAVPDSSAFWALARCAVIAIGTEGYATDQEWLRLRAVLPSLRPTVVVLAFYQNDVWCNVQPACEDTGKPRLVGATVEPPGDVRVTARRTTLARWILTHSALANAGQGLVRSQPATGSLWLPTVPDEFRVLRIPADQEIANAWRVTDTLIGQIAADVERTGARFGVLHVPLREDVHREEWAGIVRRHGWGTDWHPDASETGLRSICERRTLACAFPAHRLRAAGQTDRMYFYADPHWTVAGHRVARGVLDSLVDALRMAR